jgi:hypothetical protein
MPREHYHFIRDTITEMRLGVGCDFTLTYKLSKELFISIDAQLEFMKSNLDNIRTQFHPAKNTNPESHHFIDDFFEFIFLPIGKIRFGYLF